MNGFYEQVIAVLRKHGFSLVRQGKGSHQIWGNGKVSVSVSTNCYAKPTANKILKEAGIDHRI